MQAPRQNDGELLLSISAAVDKTKARRTIPITRVICHHPCKGKGHTQMVCKPSRSGHERVVRQNDGNAGTRKSPRHPLGVAG